MNSLAERLDAFRKIIEHDAPVVRVGCLYHKDIPEEPRVIHFERPASSFFVVADPSDDSIDVSMTSPSGIVDMVFRDCSSEEPWSSILGAKPGWMWTLTNQQGYVDGIQIDLHDGEGRFVRRLQMMVGASTISVTALSV